MLNNPLKCPFCGTNDSSTSAGDKCPGCGRHIKEKHCPICRRDRKFSSDNQVEGCWNCGTIFAAHQNGDEAALLVEEGNEGDEGLAHCGNCGGRIDENEVFCRNCGALRSR